MSDQIKKLNVTLDTIPEEVEQLTVEGNSISAQCETEVIEIISEVDDFEMSKSDFNIEKLSGSENYHDWCFAVTNVLVLKGLKNCIVEKEEVAEGQPITKLDQARSILSLCVEKHLFIHIRDCKTSLDVWKKLQNLYEDRGLQRRINLLRTLISYRLEECDDMQAYIDGIIGTASKLQSIGFQLSDDWTTAIMLAGLTDKFDPLIMTLEASSKTITADELKLKLLDAQGDSSNRKESAFVGKNGKNYKSKNNPKKKKKCWICKSFC